jgi:2-methylcitrate dehydratase PrpD
MSLTDNLIGLAATPADELPRHVLALARFSLLDWMACGVAGMGEPLAGKLRTLAEAEGGAPVASVIGGGKAPARMAALVNGATSHALDYDDTHFAHVGHLSVGIYPAVLAVAEETGATLREVTEAFLVGSEAAIRIGMVLGRAHYDLGFHQTATAGAFGAAVAAGRLYGLDAGQMCAAIGLCATRASGLKSQFGTMGKPYNAGVAAANGVEAAQLAKLGFTSADDGLMGPQGFVPTHTPEPDPAAGFAVPLSERFLFEGNRYKFHACCHGTHAMLEALIGAKRRRDLRLGDVAGMTLRTNPRWLRVCDLKTPRTGLEVKFSYAWLAGMALRGDGTGDDRAYLDALCEDAELAGFARAVTVTGDDELSDLEAAGHLTLRDGTRVEISHDLAAPLSEAELAEKLRDKARAMIGADRAEAIWAFDGSAEDAVLASGIGRLLRADMG